MSKTTYKSDRVLNTFRGTDDTAPANVYAGLITAVAGKEAGSVTEISYTSYARQAVTFAAPGAGGGGREISNSGVVSFPQCGSDPAADPIAVGIWDALTAGNLMFIIFLDADDPRLFTADESTDYLTAPAHGLSDDQTVRIEDVPGGTLPTGLSEDTTYYVINSTADTFQLSTSQGGAAVNMTADGAGVVIPFTVVPLGNGDTPEFAAGQLKIQED